ncbi:MAG: hypothetical protein ISF22_00435 [Methanomassiliicoccus sp.]|nr:hypothetical protein [Methanomassiliicoccus sp.]
MQQLQASKLFVDERSTKILLAALYRPRTALDICRATGIPVANVFCRLKLLERKGLVSKASVAYTLDGRVLPIYRSMLHDAYVFMERGKLKARFRLESCGQKDYTVDTAALL